MEEVFHKDVKRVVEVTFVETGPLGITWQIHKRHGTDIMLGMSVETIRPGSVASKEEKLVSGMILTQVAFGDGTSRKLEGDVNRTELIDMITTKPRPLTLTLGLLEEVQEKREQEKPAQDSSEPAMGGGDLRAILEQAKMVHFQPVSHPAARH